MLRLVSLAFSLPNKDLQYKVFVWLVMLADRWPGSDAVKLHRQSALLRKASAVTTGHEAEIFRSLARVGELVDDLLKATLAGKPSAVNVFVDAMALELMHSRALLTEVRASVAAGFCESFITIDLENIRAAALSAATAHQVTNV